MADQNMAKDKENVVPLYSKEPEFVADEQILTRLKESSAIEDQLTVFLMEPHEGELFTPDVDPTGLWYSFARPKAQALLKRFDVKPKDSSS